MQVQKQSVYEFARSIQKLSIPEQWVRWMKEMERVDGSGEQHAYLQRFNEYFPFNTKHWTSLAYLDLQKGKPDCIKIFQLALAKNPRSVSLWKEYFKWLKEAIQDSDPNFLIADLERGLQIIGKHPKSKFIYDFWFQFENVNILKIFDMRKRMLSSTLEEQKEALVQSKAWVKQLTFQNLNIIAKKKNIIESNQNTIRDLLDAQLTNLSLESQRDYQTIAHYEVKIQTDEYEAYKGNISIWRAYIKFTKKQYPDSIQTVYERALIANCQNPQLWKQYFEYLEFKLGKPNKALQILRSIPYFFKHFDADMICYWAELEETQNLLRARELIVQLQNSKRKLEIFLRHIDLEIRAKQFSNAKIVYDSILSTFANSVDIISFIVVQYAEFIFKYFRDIESSKKLFRVYFERYFSQYLFSGYVQFYLKHVQLKTGNRDLFNEFLEVVKAGFRRAFLELDQDAYKKLYSIISSFIRTYLPNIYFLKATEKAVREMELSLKNIDLEEIKRANVERLDAVQSLSKKKRMNLLKQSAKQQSMY